MVKNIMRQPCRIHHFDVRTVVMHVLYNSEARVSLL